ncbi:hypothetical protein KFE25_001502 [Diacronema lutheri]|uniref:Uncharacterized protein n=1 Tax=Diacronema lutheri TaxID=2081491 RepID=A0A8J6C5K2_DIALT|nr:hypothetical protein KFE25_001502 [Diacronema lutheri]|mmetsp:Transcript_9156/g.28814  ORF Transcript_9156/g.28814 Transcript_9156/m.28814 type:complete len:214 (-) Transcript_9156:98-739(-)
MSTFALQGHRPTSGARTPRRPTSARMPRARDAPEAPPPADDKPWVFGIDRALTSADMSAMGFTRVLVFDADGWVDEAAAAEVVSDAFRLPEPLRSLGLAERPALMRAMHAAFSGCASGGDLLVVIRTERLIDLEDGSADSERCYTCVGRVVDAIARAWEAANDAGDRTLAAVIVVLEMFPKRRVEPVWGEPADAERPAHTVVALEDDLSNFFE